MSDFLVICFGTEAVHIYVLSGDSPFSPKRRDDPKAQLDKATQVREAGATNVTKECILYQ